MKCKCQFIIKLKIIEYKIDYICYLFLHLLALSIKLNYWISRFVPTIFEFSVIDYLIIYLNIKNINVILLEISNFIYFIL